MQDQQPNKAKSCVPLSGQTSTDDGRPAADGSPSRAAAQGTPAESGASGHAQRQSQAAADDNPWRRFLALGKGLATEAVDRVATDHAAKRPVTERLRIGSLALYHSATPARTTAESAATRPTPLLSRLPASSTGFTAYSPSSSQWDSSHHSGRGSKTAQPALAAPAATTSLPACGTAERQQSTTPLRSRRGSVASRAAGTGSAQKEANLKVLPEPDQPWDWETAQRMSVTAATLALLAMFFLYAALILSESSRRGKASRFSVNLCISDDCSQYAATLSDAIDSSVRPCEDFEAFACGRREPTQERRSFDSRLRRQWHLVDAYLLLTRHQQQPFSEATRKAMAMLHACLQRNSLTMRRLGREALLDFLRDRGLPWPEKPTLILASRPLLVLLDLSINWAVDIWFRLTFVRGRSGNKFYFREPLVSLAIIEELRNHDGPDGGRSRVGSLLLQLENASMYASSVATKKARHDRVSSLLEGEQKVLGLLRDAVDRSAAGNNRLARQAMRDIMLLTPPFPGPTWLRVLRSVLNGTHVPVSGDDMVLVDNEYLLLVLSRLMVQMGRFALDQVALWFLQLHADLLPAPPSDQADRMRACHAGVELRYGLVLTTDYVANQLDDDRRHQIAAVANSVRDHMETVLRGDPRLPQEVKTKLAAKVENISMVLWPSNHLNNAWLTQLHNAFPDWEPSYVHFWLAAGRAQRSLLLGTNTTYSDGGDDDLRWFPSASLDPPADYRYWSNSLVLSPAALQAPLYYAQVSNAIVYAGLGATLARLMARAFDDRGIEVNGNGQLGGGWLSASARQRFDQRVTSGCWEPALEATLMAYAAAVLRLRSDTGLRLDRAYSPMELFFLTFCQPLCGLPAAVAEDHGPRPPRERLCNQALMNTRQFSSAFGCQVGKHPMAPASICGETS